MRIYLNRFLNVPPARLPKQLDRKENNDDPDSNSDTLNYDVKTLLKELPEFLDKQQQINQSGQLVADYLYNGGNPSHLLATIGNALLREDRNFHSIQMIEAAFKQYSLLSSE